MQLSRLLFCIGLLCAPVALFSTTWLYLYPIFHGCAFPTPPTALGQPAAPFRLLALGDPQLEGDSSLPDPYALVFPSLEYIVMHLQDATSSTERRSLVAEAAKGVVRDARRWLEGKRKAIDLWGNDLYLAHIVRSQRWWTQPTHISALGDLLGSQWVTDGEFEKRAGRYWGTVMRGLEKVPDSVFGKTEEDVEEKSVQILAEMPSEATSEGPAEAETEESVPGMAEVSSEPTLEFPAESTLEDLLEAMSETSADVVPEPVEAISESIEASPEPIENIPESLEPISEEPTETGQSDAQERRDDGNNEVEQIHDWIGEWEGSGDNYRSEEERLLEAFRDGIEQGTNGHEQHQKETSDREEVHEETSDKEQVQEETSDQQSLHESTHEELHEGTHEGPPEKERKPTWGGTREVLGADKSWEKRVINIVGNHDIGYAGDLDESRVERFEKAFGDANWDIWFTLPEHLRTTKNNDEALEASEPPALRVVVLNSMNLDTPVWSHELQTETYSFMNRIITTSRPVTDKTHATILLTHIPLEKESGICVDSPYFDFWEGGHGVKEQNMLSDHSSKILLEGIFGLNGNKYAEGGGMGRRGIVVNGHDHAGCDVTHWIKQLGVEHSCNASTVKQAEAYWPLPPSNDTTAVLMPKQSRNNPDFANPFIEATSLPNEEPEPEVKKPEQEPMPKWKARRFPPLPYDINDNNECTVINDSPHIREITLRSMMGEFSGYAGFLAAWFDPSLGDKGEWVFEFNTCGLGIQHWWWAVHSIDFGVVVMLAGAGVASILEKTVWKEKKTAGSSSRAKGVQSTNGTMREMKR